MVTDNQTLEKVYTAKNHEELMDAYKDWAADYDADTVDRFGYVAHAPSFCEKPNNGNKNKSVILIIAFILLKFS